MRNRVERIHFVGVGGVGMCGIAEVLHNMDFKVSGSDLNSNANTQRLESMGARILIGHDASFIKGADVVVTSSAVAADNPEVVAALEQKIPVVPRAEMLAELMRLQQGIAVAGTHGKTTTTSLIASVLAEGELDPTFVIGGKLISAGANARLGKGKYLVAEADESDASFLHLQPLIAVVTNIDADHMETYDGDFDKLKQAFVDFLHNLPFYGLAILCLDDPVIQELLADIHKPILTYGFSEGADVRASNLRQSGQTSTFAVSLPDGKNDIEVILNHPGHHNAQNALAAIAVAHELGVDTGKILSGLKQFAGIGRRFQIVGKVDYDGGDILFIDDYAHHPKEIEATLQALRAGWPDRRAVVVFQPHRYTRTRDLMDDFVNVLADQEPLLITEVYAAGESSISGADGRSLCKNIRARGKSTPVFVEDIHTLPGVLADLVQENDVVLTLGAGNIGQIAASLPDAIVQQGVS